MKPRTKLQCQVVDLSNSLRELEDKILSWAKIECLEHKGYATKSRIVCMDCGQRFSPEIVSRKRAICPHCGAKLKIEQSRKTTDKQQIYVAMADVYGEFQVIRNFEIFAYHKAGSAARYFIHEILQDWILTTNKHEIIARLHTCNSYCDAWTGSMEIRKDRPNYWSSGKYSVYPQAYHPDSVFKEEYKKYGINDALEEITFMDAIKLLPDNPKAETLLKAKQYELLRLANNNSGSIERYWPSIKICMRNKYIVKDAQIYIDHLDLLKQAGKDLHNAYYVCPKNLKKEHERLVARKRKIQEKKDAEYKRLEALEDEKKFQELKKKFFGISFQDDLIRVKVIESVQEFMQEGDILHHCVFTNSYYLREDSLILSARIRNKPIETVEVSLKELDIVQSRGVCNKSSKYHDQIIKLVKRNLDIIRKRMLA